MPAFLGVASAHPFVDKISIASVFFRSATGGLTAFAGGGQAGALPLPSIMNKVTTVATAADSVLLPKAYAGMSVVVKNGAASNSMNVFPYLGDAVNALSANAAYAIAVTKTVEFVCFVDGTWDTILTA
jgi:ascorbate-specific PTS system EIIC-type component UlaA